MCQERIQRYLAAFMIVVSTLLIVKGIIEGIYLLWFVSSMLIIWGTFDFCPSLWILKKIGIRNCGFKK